MVVVVVSRRSRRGAAGILRFVRSSSSSTGSRHDGRRQRCRRAAHLLRAVCLLCSADAVFCLLGSIAQYCVCNIRSCCLAEGRRTSNRQAGSTTQKSAQALCVRACVPQLSLSLSRKRSAGVLSAHCECVDCVQMLLLLLLSSSRRRFADELCRSISTLILVAVLFCGLVCGSLFRSSVCLLGDDTTDFELTRVVSKHKIDHNWGCLPTTNDKRRVSPSTTDGAITIASHRSPSWCAAIRSYQSCWRCEARQLDLLFAMNALDDFYLLYICD